MREPALAAGGRGSTAFNRNIDKESRYSSQRTGLTGTADCNGYHNSHLHTRGPVYPNISTRRLPDPLVGKGWPTCSFDESIGLRSHLPDHRAPSRIFAPDHFGELGRAGKLGHCALRCIDLAQAAA